MQEQRAYELPRPASVELAELLRRSAAGGEVSARQKRRVVRRAICAMLMRGMAGAAP